MIIDGVVHPFELRASNVRSDPDASRQANAVYHHHVSLQRDPEYAMPRDEFFRDCDLDVLSHAIFVESDIDMAILHALPTLGFTKGPATSVDRVADLKQQFPSRYLLYGTVDPTHENAIDELRRQCASFDIDGLKLYPSSFSDGKVIPWRLDDEKLLFPLIEEARTLGIRNIAIHKAIPVGMAPLSSYRVDDLEPFALTFKDMNLQIVHGGWAFLEETCLLMKRFSNVYALLENTICWINLRPEIFATIIGEMLYWSSPNRSFSALGAIWCIQLPSLGG